MASSGHHTPDTILARLTAGRPDADQAAWARFVDLYTPLLYYWARRLGLQEADALDLVQDVFLHLYQKLPHFQYDQSKSFRNWLHTVFTHKWVDRQRRAAAKVTGDAGALDRVSVADPVEGLAEADHQRYLVRLALKLMQTDFEASTWQAFWEVTVQGRTPAEVAEQLGLTVAAVYKAVSRVRHRLRVELDNLAT